MMMILVLVHVLELPLVFELVFMQSVAAGLNKLCESKLASLVVFLRVFCG